MNPSYDRLYFATFGPEDFLFFKWNWVHLWIMYQVQFLRWQIINKKSYFPSVSLQTRVLAEMFPVQDGSLLQRCLPGIVCLTTCLYDTSVCLPVCWNVRLPQRQAWSVHRTECECLRRLLPRIPTDSVRLSARLIFALVRFPPSDAQNDVNVERQDQIFLYVTFCLFIGFCCCCCC